MAKPARRVKALTDRPNPPSPAPTREQRLAEALRQNLRRRKGQSRETEIPNRNIPPED